MSKVGMTSTKVGGVFLGEGSYGCTFSPAVVCKDKDRSLIKKKRAKDDEKLTKVFWSDRDVEDEWRFAKILQSVDPRQEYFIYPNERCVVSKKDVMKQANSSKCNSLNNVRDKNAKLPVLQMKYGGVTLEQWVQEKRRRFVDFLPMLRHILVGVQKLHRKGYLHHDLKIDNILVDDNDVPHIIDLSLLVPLKDVFDTSLNPSLYNQYWLHPPEYRIQRFNHDLSDIDADLPSFVSRHVQQEADLYYFKIQMQDISTVNQFLLAYFPYCEMYDITKKYIKTLFNVYKSHGKQGLMKYQTKFASKVDVYSIGLTVMNIIYHMDAPSNDSRFRTLITGMIHPDPRKRFSVGKCIHLLDTLIRDYELTTTGQRLRTDS